MSDLNEKFLNLDLTEEIFKGIKFFVSGEVHDKIEDLLKCGGAVKMNYFSDYVTHLIVGENPEENDISDASDLYEIPALTPKWVLMSSSLRKLVDTTPYLYPPSPKLFSNLIFCFSKLEDRNILWALISYNGGLVHTKLTNKCNFLVTSNTDTPKYLKANELGPNHIKIITPDWIMEAVKCHSFPDPTLFHPKLINWPKPPKPHESTTAITGFEPETVEPVEKLEEKNISDSTQALLEELKQRMPWNQPAKLLTTSSVSDPVAPPNVVAPSFLNKMQNVPMVQSPRVSQPATPVSHSLPPQSSVSSSFPNVPHSPTHTQQPSLTQQPTHAQQLPRSVVHHTPLAQNQQTTFPQQQQNPLNINRLIGQPQTRPNLQQLRGQLSQNQMHQQLMQQRLQQQQQNQNIIQRTSTGHITVQQQLLQQQQQRQMLQNQLLSQQQGQNPQAQQQNVSQNQHLNQLNPQQIQQLQQLKQNQQQQQLLNQNQQLINPNQQQINQPIQNQQLLQNQQVIQQQNINQQQMQMNQNPNFVQQQHLIQQKQQLFNQQQQTNQQQIIQNQPNLAIQQQQQFVGQNFNQNQQDSLQQQQKLGQPQISQQNQLNQQTNLNQINVQTLNQQLTTQNLGQQLNQQQLNQQNQQLNQGGLNQQLNLDQGLVQNVNQGLNQQPQQNQGLQQVNQQLNQHSLQQQQLSQQLNQQLTPGLPQQVVRTQFQQGNVVNQQLLINQQQQQSPQQQQPQRAQINQHLWAQQQQGQIQAQQIIRHPVNVVQQTAGGPRIQWSPNQQQGNIVPQRQFIQLDAQTHNQLQKMPPDQQALFVARLQKQQRQLQLAKQVQQRGGGGHILIRGNVPPGLTAQQQVQWLQQQAKQQGIVLPPNIQQQNITPGTLTPQPLAQNIQHAPGLSPINQNNPQFGDQNQQIHLRQYRLQQLQLQRDQAQKNHLAQQQGSIQQPAAVRPIGQPQTADSTTNPPQVQDGGAMQHSLVVNAKTKTALANMLSIKLQSGGTSIGSARPEALPEPSAAGTLRLMTAQHNAALNSKPQEIIALQQRRIIGGSNGEIIKPPGPQLPLTPQNEPPKLQFCQKPPLPVQHRVGPFYGHNPNLKLPPDLFLLGCIFVVIEIEEFLDERLAGWQQKIEKHGGEVEKQYCSKVTHVLCETQRHGVVMQALRDCKRCVTVLWLSDVMKRKQVLPPWTALHLPQIYLDTMPASKHLISISGFVGSDRNRVKQMIKYTGAKCTTYFSKHNTLLICAKAEGKKCSHAKKWGIPVVNVQWLTDVILGNFTALNQMDHQVYQTFSNPPNMSFDPKLVPNMMHAWKAPINISQESYERVKRSASPIVLPKAKKQKTEHTDENDNISEDVTNSEYRILFSLVENEQLKELEKMVRELGGSIAKAHSDFTHLVMPHLTRSTKLFFAIAKGLPLISPNWIKESHSCKQLLPESNFTLNTEPFNKKYNLNLDKTLQCYNRDKLFEGRYFWVSPSVIPSKKIVTELIQTCGGTVERIRRSAAQIEAVNLNFPYSYFIITAKHDLHLVADLLKSKKDKQRVVCNVEFIFSSILKQNVDVEPYAVSVM